jgi:hypothetical protein
MIGEQYSCPQQFEELLPPSLAAPYSSNSWPPKISEAISKTREKDPIIWFQLSSHY